MVKVFPDKIEFYNPGALPDTISVQQLVDDAYVSQPRNKLIAEMFKESGFIEKYGSGIKRVIKAFVEMDLPKPNFISMPSGFKVVVYGKTHLEKDLEKRSLSENQKRILDLIRDNAYITQAELSKHIGINEKNIRINISKLKAKGLLKRIGSDKGGYWKEI
jgi:ATP-dependent DNA helicase RecG